MTSSLPVLEVYYIDISKDKKTENILKIAKNPMLNALQFIMPFPLRLYLLWLEKRIGKSDFTSLAEIIRNNRFEIITTEEELKKYTNAFQNEWIDNDKLLKKRQYYIRHPKKEKGNILIEAQKFYEYIKDEQLTELIQYVKSHCSAKKIIIDTNEAKGAGVGISGIAKEFNIGADASGKKDKVHYYAYTNPAGITMEKPADNYYWLDSALKKSIDSLTDGASFTKSFSYDFTCGLSIGEAKTLGLDTNMYKTHSYTITIEC